jgi:hypothetical protein
MSDEEFDDLIELFNAKDSSLTIESINLNNAVFTMYKERVLIDVYEKHYAANRMQLAVEKKDIPKLIKFLQHG